MDEATNSLNKDYWDDRLGRKRLTWEGMTRLSNLGAAVEAAERAEAAADAAEQVSSMSTYLTKADADAALPQSEGTYIRVTNDPDPANNGYWVSDGSQWIWSGVQSASRIELSRVAYETLKPGNRWFDFWGLDTLDYTPLVYVNTQNHMKFDVPAVQILLDFHVIETSDFSVLRVAQDGSMLSSDQDLVLGESQFDGEPYRSGAFVGLPPDLSSIFYEQTPTYEQLIAAYDALLEGAGSAMSKRELGLDSGGQSVWCYSLKAPPRVTHNQETRDLLPKRKKAVLVGGIHAGELPGIITLYLAVRHLIQFSEQDAELALLRHSVDFEIIPVAVPASYGTARRNANGVDVNRNFDIEWEEGSDDPNSLMYRGPAPESEPETRLLLGVVSDPDVTHVIDAHAHGQTDALWWYGAATRADMAAAAISGERMTAIAYQQYGFIDNRSICFYQRNRSGGLIAYAGLTLERHAVLHESHQLTHPYVVAQPSVVKRRLNEMSYLELLKSLILSGN
jgi:hypothetical protein